MAEPDPNGAMTEEIGILQEMGHPGGLTSTDTELRTMLEKGGIRESLIEVVLNGRSSKRPLPNCLTIDLAPLLSGGV